MSASNQEEADSFEWAEADRRMARHGNEKSRRSRGPRRDQGIGL